MKSVLSDGADPGRGGHTELPSEDAPTPPPPRLPQLATTGDPQGGGFGSSGPCSLIVALSYQVPSS